MDAPATDSVPGRNIRLLRELRHAFRAANECVERTGNTERELAMMSALVYVESLLREGLTKILSDKDSSMVTLATLKIRLLEEAPTPEVLDEVRELMKEVNLSDIFERVLAFDVAEHLAGGGARFAGFTTDDDEDEDEEDGERRFEEEKQAWAPCLLQALVENGIDLSPEKVLDLVDRAATIYAEREGAGEISDAPN